MTSSAPRAADALRYNGLWWRRFAYLGCVYGPEWWKHYSPPVIGAIIFGLIGRNRRGAITNLQQVLGTTDVQATHPMALRMFAEFARCFAEAMEYLGPHPQPMVFEQPSPDPLAAALEAGRGAVVVTGHLGSWDIGAKAVRDYGRPINIVMAREANASAQQSARRMREDVGVRVLYSDTSVFSSLNMIRALRANEIVAIQLDRMVALNGARWLPFFGRPAPFPSGPFVLARLAGAPLFATFVPRVGRRRYAVRVDGPFVLRHDARDSQSLEIVMAQVVRSFEAVIREFPHQWFQFTPFWVPPPAPPAAALTADAPAFEPRRARV